MLFFFYLLKTMSFLFVGTEAGETPGRGTGGEAI